MLGVGYKKELQRTCSSSQPPPLCLSLEDALSISFHNAGRNLILQVWNTTDSIPSIKKTAKTVLQSLPFLFLQYTIIS